jgi:hypothetical protein
MTIAAAVAVANSGPSEDNERTHERTRYHLRTYFYTKISQPLSLSLFLSLSCRGLYRAGPAKLMIARIRVQYSFLFLSFLLFFSFLVWEMNESTTE